MQIEEMNGGMMEGVQSQSQSQKLQSSTSSARSNDNLMLTKSGTTLETNHINSQKVTNDNHLGIQINLTSLPSSTGVTDRVTCRKLNLYGEDQSTATNAKVNADLFAEPSRGGRKLIEDVGRL